ncbi:MAG TPA: PadR family transcriptional regulator [Micromonosporaceae bacterium]
METISALGHALLCALHREPLTGYDLVRRMRRPIGYYWSAQQSQIYPELTRLTEAGLIEHEAEPGPGPRQRKTHRLTAAGRDELAAWLVSPPAPHAPRDEAVLKTYALAAADPSRMREMYLREAGSCEQRRADFERQRADLVARGADRPEHPEFGSYATLNLAVSSLVVRTDWCRWVADRLDERASRSGGAG